MSARSSAAIVLLFLIFVSGCESAPPRGFLKGRVVNRGQAVTAARIYFENSELGSGTVVDLDAEGRFVVATAEGPGLPPGTYQVAVKPQGKGAPPSPKGDLPPEALAGSSAAKEPPPVNELVPAKSYDFATSGLKVELQAGENPDWEIDLGK